MDGWVTTAHLQGCRYRVYEGLRGGMAVLTVVFVIVLITQLLSLILSAIYCSRRITRHRQLIAYKQPLSVQLPVQYTLPPQPQPQPAPPIEHKVPLFVVSVYL